MDPSASAESCLLDFAEWPVAPPYPKTNVRLQRKPQCTKPSPLDHPATSDNENYNTSTGSEVMKTPFSLHHGKTNRVDGVTSSIPPSALEPCGGPSPSKPVPIAKLNNNTREREKRDEQLLSADYPYCISDSLDSGPSGNEFPTPPSSSSSLLQQSLQQHQQQQRKKKKKRRYTGDCGDTDPVNAFLELYDQNEDILGEGALSSVHTCIEKATMKEFAVKIVHCKSIDHRRRLLREIEILHLCQHQNHVVHLKEYFEHKDRFYVVFYKANGGPLLEHIRRKKCFREDEARAVMKEIAEALVFLHHKGIAHRDLKPANILCERNDQVTPIQICDFDLGSRLSSSKSPSYTPQLGTPVGSCEFMAPEVIAAFSNQDLTYDKKCDMWSLGVILYIMLSGRAPFGGGCNVSGCQWESGGNCFECQELLIEAIKRCRLVFPPEDWRYVSEPARNLIQRLLTACPRDRLGAAEVLEHPWMTQEASNLPLNTAHNLKKLGTQSHASVRLQSAYSSVSLTNSWRRIVVEAQSPAEPDTAYTDDYVRDCQGTSSSGPSSVPASMSPDTKKKGDVRQTHSLPYFSMLERGVQMAFSEKPDSSVVVVDIDAEDIPGTSFISNFLDDM